jgi:hypothetical protein
MTDSLIVDLLADLLTDGVLTASNQQAVFTYCLFIQAVIGCDCLLGEQLNGQVTKESFRGLM